mmetsp:Transcript_7025/g.8124  ORF Transcript_7025/g.8124 Transcript_7025/m.8124 type:complete len:143 (+) Transcript_7025:180-608(+)|eukprot:CAMPEP_0198263428 /NCGR_PEP_ID=MMETSP1447-20131203/11747_1 /TAXON_ID=420782 /ORGANISM="Chaetoceros dichaeta, Strain CCMP1751" /LENGTH=142 /DNA_ID=CAMNT_0043951995 /DNA_START=153 /DNA_END=581 /DNA_ORIENTATION=+
MMSEVNKYELTDHNKDEKYDRQKTRTGNAHVGAGTGMAKMLKSLSGRRLRARNTFDPTLITKLERRQLAEGVRDDECGMQKMKSRTDSDSGKGRKFKFKTRLSQVSTAALAPRAAIKKWIDPENGEGNLGFYRHVILGGDDG